MGFDLDRIMPRLFPVLLAFALCGHTVATDSQSGTGNTTRPAATPAASDLSLASGTIFEDRNGNRQHQPGGHGQGKSQTLSPSPRHPCLSRHPFDLLPYDACKEFFCNVAYRSAVSDTALLAKSVSG